ncbi:hypothetical protein FJT64_020665 [Amphibalanus amphitrite]|uniref:Uncharacterized protein n=1 Tax=Amphibalanus amphitrite TaxID=1232801 RepID=A0A6A4WKY8_AMPAM|nr:hypothetical protein FJT64_020665 [Amphibalanus amphitrite]
MSDPLGEGPPSKRSKFGESYGCGLGDPGGNDMGLSSFDLELSLPDELMGGLESSGPVSAPAPAPAYSQYSGSPGVNGSLDSAAIHQMMANKQQLVLGGVAGLQSPPGAVVSKSPGLGPMSSMAQHVSMDGGLLGTMTSSMSRLSGSPLAAMSVTNSMSHSMGGGVSMSTSVPVSMDMPVSSMGMSVSSMGGPISSMGIPASSMGMSVSSMGLSVSSMGAPISSMSAPISSMGVNVSMGMPASSMGISPSSMGVSVSSMGVSASSMGGTLPSAAFSSPQLSGSLSSAPVGGGGGGGAPLRFGVAGGGQWLGRPMAQQFVNGPGAALTRTVPSLGGQLRNQAPLQQQQQQQLRQQLQQQQQQQQQRHMQLPQTSGIMQVRTPAH